ncbi:MAG TPA: DUF3788 family protein [Bacteroidota bacterium]
MKPAAPTDAKLKRMLGDRFAEYQSLLKLTAPCPHEWMFYGPKYGWKIKFVGKEKVLLYFTPRENSFSVGFAVRDAEREALMNSELPSATKEKLGSAKRFPEGYPLLFGVSRKSDMSPVRLVIETLMSMRS